MIEDMAGVSGEVQPRKGVSAGPQLISVLSCGTSLRDYDGSSKGRIIRIIARTRREALGGAWSEGVPKRDYAYGTPE
jgi:hypothetical protein